MKSWLRIVNHRDKHDNSVMFEKQNNEIKFDLKLLRMEIEVAMQRPACKLQLEKKTEYCYFVNSCEIIFTDFGQVLQKLWQYKCNLTTFWLFSNYMIVVASFEK